MKLFIFIFIFTMNSVSAMGNGQNDQARCEKLSGFQFSDSTVTLATFIAAGKFSDPNGEVHEVPAFCLIKGIARPTSVSRINFEVWLPTDTWNGRYYQFGGGGLEGYIYYPALAKFLSEGNAVATTDTGHDKKSEESTWMLNQPERVKDWGYRALKTTTNSAKIIINRFYGRAAHHNYFTGCSAGGRHGLIAAQRYPEDWDGIIVGAPAHATTRQLLGNHVNWSTQWQKPENLIPREKLPLIQKTALASCKKEAYLVGDIAADPRFCQFDPNMLLCTGKEKNNCLTPPQVATLTRIYDGTRHPRTGALIYPGLVPTLETYSYSAFRERSPQGSTRRFITYFGLDEVIKFEQSSQEMQIKMFDGKRLSDVIDATDINLEPLRKKGAKILMYTGWGDDLVAPEETINYYENVVKNTGGLKKTKDFFRFFTVPGMMHCAGGPGANSFGQMFVYNALHNNPNHHISRAMEKWVETGVAPDKIIATKFIDDKLSQGVSFSRPLCPYPQVATYQGYGPKHKPESFKCLESSSFP